MFAAQYKRRTADLRDEQYCFADGCGDLYLCAHTATAARFAAGCCIEVGTGMDASALLVVLSTRCPTCTYTCVSTPQRWRRMIWTAAKRWARRRNASTLRFICPQIFGLFLMA